MPGDVVGRARIIVDADASALGSSLQKQGQSAAKAAAAGISGAIGSTLKKGAAVTGLAVGGILGSALVKGFQRLSSIDQATQKLKGLGHSADSVKTIMDNALASVKGTAFGLGDAASQAASLVAAGIKPGKELERTLKLLADSSTIAGVDLADMGLVFGKVAASGKLTGESLMQLQERGVPVMKFLADTTGKSMEQVQKDISAGKISFETFQKAMEQGLGGAAASSGKTFVGAWANVQAALGRVGAGLLGGVFKQMTGIFATLVAWLDKVTPAATKFGDAFGDAFGKAWTVAKALIDLIFGGDYTGGLSEVLGIEEDSAIVGVILSIRDAITSLLDKVGPALDKLPTGVKIAGIAGGLALIGPALSGMVGSLPVVGGLVQSISGLGTASRVVGPVVGKLGPMLKAGLTSPVGLATIGVLGLGAGLLAMSKDGGAGFTKFVQGISAQVVQFANALPGIVSSVTTMLPGLISTALGTLDKILPTLIKAVVEIVNAIVGLLPTLLPVLLDAALQLFMALVNAATQILPALIKAIILIVNALVKLLPTLIPILIDAAITLLMALVDAVDEILPPLITAIVDLIDALIGSLDTILPVLLDAAVDLFMAFVDALPRIIPVLIDGAVALIDAVIRMLPTLIPLLLNAAIALFMAIVNSLPRIIPLLIEGAIRLIFAVIKLLPTLIPTLLSAALTLFLAIVKAVPQILGGLLKAFGDVLGRAWGYITGTFEGWRKGAIEWFGKIGKGIADKWGELTSWLRKPVDTALEWIQVNLIDRFNGLLSKLGISWQIGRIWWGGRQSTAGLYSGGYSGGGDPRKPAGIVHGREWVLNHKATAALIRDYGVGFLQALNGYAAGGWVTPVTGYKPAFPWGRYPSGGIHLAYDYAVPTGTPVNAPDDGRVAKSGWDSTGYGISVFLDHANGLFSVLGHLRNIIVRTGQFVSAGMRIGYSDNTGRSTGPHLHWGVMKGGIYGPGVNPGEAAAGGGLDVKKLLADLVRSISRGAGGGLDWVAEHLGPMGRIIAGVGKKFLGFLTEKALDMLGFGEGGGFGSHMKPLQFDNGGWLQPGWNPPSYNGTGRPEPVGWPSTGPTNIYVTISVDDLAKMSKIGDFLDMLDNARVDNRRSERSGRVNA